MKQQRDAKGHFLPYTLDQRYDLYVNEYKKAETSLARQGQEMYLGKLNKAQFVARIIAEENSGRKADAQFVRNFVDASKYETTRAQANKIKQAFKELTGEEYSLLSIRKKTPKVIAAWNQLSNEYKAMRLDGFSSKAAAEMISWAYFGSE